MLMNLFSWLSRFCSPKRQFVEVPLFEVTKSMEEGFMDLSFSMVGYERFADGTQVCEAKGLHGATQVGFRFRLSSEWQQGELGSTGITTCQSTLILESIGIASDQFVALLSKLYGRVIQPAKMVPAIRFTAISLEGNPAQLEKRRVRIKLFIEPDEEGDEAYELYYAEHYLNVDWASRIVEFHEKDSEYRDPILRALSGIQ